MEVWLNSTKVGVSWTDFRHLDITGILKTGENLLEILVTSRLFNRVKGYIDHEMTWKPNYIIKSPNYNAREDFEKVIRKTPLLHCGLIGPVSIRFFTSE